MNTGKDGSDINLNLRMCHNLSFPGVAAVVSASK